VKKLVERKPWDDPRYFFGGPTERQARRIAWEDFKALIPRSWVKRIYEGAAVIRTIFGSELHVFGMDKAQRMEGTPWDWGVIDEASDQKPETFDRVVYPALADRNGGCDLIGVPKRNGPGAKTFKAKYEYALSGEDPDWAAFHWRSCEILPAETIRAALSTLDPKTYREQFDASFESAGGLIYYQFSREYNVRPCIYKPDLPLLIGQDFNVDPMCWVIAQSPAPYHLEVIDELFVRDCTTAIALNILYDRWKHHKAGFEFYGDAAGRQRRTSATHSDYLLILNDDRFKELGRTVHYPRSNPSCADRYATVNAALCNAAGVRRLHIDPKCKRLIDGLESDYYKPGTREAEKVGDLTHMTDALGYLVMRKIPLVIRTDQKHRFSV